MHSNVATLILAGATPVEINPSQTRTPRRIGAYSADGQWALGRRASKDIHGGWLLMGWAIWRISAPHAYRVLCDWEHPDAQWDQIPLDVLTEFVEGS